MTKKRYTMWGITPHMHAYYYAELDTARDRWDAMQLAFKRAIYAIAEGNGARDSIAAWNAYKFIENARRLDRGHMYHYEFLGYVISISRNH